MSETAILAENWPQFILLDALAGTLISGEDADLESVRSLGILGVFDEFSANSYPFDGKDKAQGVMDRAVAICGRVGS